LLKQACAKVYFDGTDVGSEMAATSSRHLIHYPRGSVEAVTLNGRDDSLAWRPSYPRGAYIEDPGLELQMFPFESFSANGSSYTRSSNDMNIIVPRRPLANNLPFLLPSLLKSPSQVTRRHESSARRTTKRLRTKPDPSFTSSISPSHAQDHIVFNPPSSAPSVYHTPAAFLPPDDPRRQLLAQSHSHANPYDQPDRRLPPPVRKPREKKYNLGEKEIEEIRKLRTEDPFKWTRKTLAEKYDCSQFFVGLICQASVERLEQQRQVLDDIKSKWGQRRRHAREDRTRRRELWGRDE